MDELKKRAIDRILQEQSSLLSRAALDAIHKMPDYQRTIIDRIAEENKRLLQSFAGLQFPTASDALIETVKNIGLLEQKRLHDSAFSKASSVIEEAIRQTTRSAEFKLAQLTAADAIASTLRVSQDYQRGIASSFAEIHRQAATESAASLSALISQQFKALEDVQSAFARSMVQEMRDALADFEQRQHLSIQELEESLTERIDELPETIKDPAWLRKLQFLAAVASLLGLLIPLVQLAASKGKTNEDQEKLRTVIVALIQEAITKTERELTIFYIAQRTVMLKETPDHKSKTVTTIPKGDEVRLIKRKHKWIYVEYTQDTDEKPLYGWVDKKYLRLVVRSVEEARRSNEFINTFESILSRRRTAYEELAKGPHQ